MRGMTIMAVTTMSRNVLRRVVAVIVPTCAVVAVLSFVRLDSVGICKWPSRKRELQWYIRDNLANALMIEVDVVNSDEGVITTFYLSARADLSRLANTLTLKDVEDDTSVEGTYDWITVRVAGNSRMSFCIDNSTLRIYLGHDVFRRASITGEFVCALYSMTGFKGPPLLSCHC